MRSASTAAWGRWPASTRWRRLGAARPGGPRPLDHAQRGPAAAARGPVRLRGRAATTSDRSCRACSRPGRGIVGGCCGTTPAHVAAMRHRARRPGSVAAGPRARRRRDGRRGRGLRRGAPGAIVAGGRPRISFPRPRQRPPATRQPGSRLARALADRRFVVSVEIDPPRSIRIERTLEAARLLRDAGADLVNVSDSAMARVRMGALAVAFGIQHDLDLECVVHVTTRDRNLMALESELLGAHALGVRNILALTGDPPRVGDYPTGTGVWDVDSIGLIEILARLNRGEDQAGSPIGQQAVVHDRLRARPHRGRPRRRVGPAGAQAGGRGAAGDDPAAVRRAPRSRRCSAMRGERFGQGGFPVPVLLGVLPLVSARHAEFLHNEVPGITIPEAARARMQAAGPAGTEAGIEMADALLAAVGRRGRRDLPHAQLRPLRAGGRAGAAHPHAERSRRRASRVACDRAPGSPFRPARARSAPPGGAGPARPRAGRRRLRAAVPGARQRPGRVRHGGRLPRLHRDQGRGDDRRDREPHRRRGRGLHPARAVLDRHRPGRAAGARADGPVGRRPPGHRRRAGHPVRPLPGQRLPRPGPAVRRTRLRARRTCPTPSARRIYSNDMLPLLESCDLDGALLAAMARIDANATPEHAGHAVVLPPAERGAGAAGRAAAGRAADRIRAARLDPARPRPRLPRRSVDPHPGTSATASRPPRAP